MEPRKPRSKTVVLIVVIGLVLASIAFYYVAALRNSDNRPRSVETQSVVISLPQR